MWFNTVRKKILVILAGASAPRCPPAMYGPEVSAIHNSPFFRYRLSPNGITDLKMFRGFREMGPQVIDRVLSLDQGAVS